MRGLHPAPEHALHDPREPQSGRRHRGHPARRWSTRGRCTPRRRSRSSRRTSGTGCSARASSKTVRFAEAPVKGMSVLKYDPNGHGGRRLSPAGEGGALEWEAVSARACGKGRWPPCSGRRRPRGSRPRAAPPSRRAAGAEPPRARRARARPTPQERLRHAFSSDLPENMMAPPREPAAAAASARLPVGRRRRRTVGAAAAARRRRRRRRRQRRQPHDRGRGRRASSSSRSTRTRSRCSSPPRT